MKKVPFIMLAAALILSAALSFAPTESQAATCIKLTRDLERGMKGNDVLLVQSFLVEQRFLSSAAFQAGAGMYGPKTVTAVRSFQSSVGINATGYIGPVTRQALTNATCGTTTSSISGIGGGGGGPESDPTGLGTPIVIGGSPTGLSVALTTERANNTFSQVDSIRLYVTVHNAGASAFPLTFPTTCQVSYTIGTAFNFADWRTCQQAPATITVAPNGGSFTWELTYTPATFGQLAVGAKTLRATVGNYGSDELSLTITAIQPGQQAPVTPQGSETPTTPTTPTVGGGPVPPVVPTTVGGGPVNPNKTNFAIFDAIAGYNGKPSPTFLNGLNEMCGSYTYSFFTQNNLETPNEQVTRAHARSLPSTCKYYFVDIEHLPYDFRKVSTEQVLVTAQKFKQIIAWVRSERPGMKIGIYGILPVGDYWTPNNYEGSLTIQEPWWVAQVTRFTQDFVKWQQANNVLSSLATNVDFVAPNLYDPYPNSLSGWKVMARYNIQEAKRYGKPVYPFLWFHIDNAEYSYQRIPASQMRQQFDWIKQSGADGLIMWDYGSGAPWPNFDWIPELQSFINANNINPTLPASAIDAVGGRSATTAAYILAGGFTLIFLSLVLLGLTVFKKTIRRGR